MLRSSTLVICAVPLALAFSAIARGEQAAAPAVVKPPPAPLFFRETWNVTTTTHSGALAQTHVSNPNLLLKLYGSPKDIDPARGLEQGLQANGGPGPVGTGHIFTGLCERPCAMALRDRNNYVDLSGLGKIHWLTAITGLHQVHPIIKLADGQWLLGEHGDGTVFDYHPYEFTLSEMRWIAMDMENVFTRGRWLDKVDLSKVDEIGFADLMPGSGHGDGGFSNLAWIEVYGRPVPRSGAAPK